MANITGSGGCVKSGATVIVGIKEWSSDFTTAIFDSTAFADTAPTFKSSIVGIANMTGSITGIIQSDDTGATGALDVGTSYTLNLETDGTDKYSMTAYITGISASVSVTGEATVTANFQSSGTVAYTDA